MIDIDKILGDNRQSRAIVGLNRVEFELLLPNFEASLKAQKKLIDGRPHTLATAKEKLFFILSYLKTYQTCDVIAAQYGVDKSRVSRWTRDYLPILSITLDHLNLLPLREITSKEQFKEVFPKMKDIFIDATEREIQRPQNQKSQRKHYSGKQKTHTKKTSQSQTKTRKSYVLVRPNQEVLTTSSF